MTAAAQAEMFPDFPTTVKTKRVKSKWEELNELVDLVDKHGALIPMPMVAELLDVHRSRVYQLVESGDLAVIEFRDRQFVTEKTVRAFVELERKAGRPPKERSDVKVAWKMARALATGK